MTLTFIGIGTKFYGKEDAEQTNACIATKWIVFFYIPILPMGSFQECPVERDNEKNNGAIAIGSPENVVKRVPLQWLHVCNVYAFMVAVAILAYLGVSHRQTSLASKSSSPSEVSSVAPNLETVESTLPFPSAEPAYERPTTAENGVPFPETSSYVKGYKQAFTNGRTILTVDNAKNNYDIHVKLYNLDVTPPGLASVFFVKTSDQFTVEQITPGSYELRYRNLDTGDLFRTEALPLEETVDPSGRTAITHLTVRLYGAIDGEMETYPITEEDF